MDFKFTALLVTMCFSFAVQSHICINAGRRVKVPFGALYQLKVHLSIFESILSIYMYSIYINYMVVLNFIAWRSDLFHFCQNFACLADFDTPGKQLFQKYKIAHMTLCMHSGQTFLMMRNFISKRSFRLGF